MQPVEKSSWPDLPRPSTSFSQRHCQDVDARHKAGHDEENSSLTRKPKTMSTRIVDVREVTKPIASPIRNAYIDFTKMTTSLVAVVTDAVRDGKTVVGYGFNSNGRYGQGGLIRERFAPRLLEAEPKTLLDETGGNLDPDKVWATLMSNEKPGGHGERSVAVGTIDMAAVDAGAKIARQPPFPLVGERPGHESNHRLVV